MPGPIVAGRRHGLADRVGPGRHRLRVIRTGTDEAASSVAVTLADCAATGGAFPRRRAPGCRWGTRPHGRQRHARRPCNPLRSSSEGRPVSRYPGMTLSPQCDRSHVGARYGSRAYASRSAAGSLGAPADRACWVMIKSWNLYSPRIFLAVIAVKSIQDLLLSCGDDGRTGQTGRSTLVKSRNAGKVCRFLAM